MRASGALFVLCGVALGACGTSVPATDGGADGQSGALGLAINTIAGATVGTTATFSSSSLRATWTAPSGIDHVRLSLTGGGDTFVFDAKPGATALDLTDLHSSTSYTISASLCADAACATPTPAGSSLTADVPAEVWGLQGSGDGVTKATKIVADGNVRIHAIAYGKDAPAAQLGRTRLYYGPQPNVVQGLVVGLAKQAASATVSTLDSFESLAGSSGVEKPTPTATWITDVMTGQAVPLGGALGEKIRHYFESPGSDGKTRILYVDSADGYVGRDFNSGADTRCRSGVDYAAGGGCEAKLAIGVAGDTGDWGLAMTNVRQFKIGVKTLDDWRWRGETGTFMWVTIDQTTGCTTASHNQAFAAWDGTGWKFQKDASGCPLLMSDAQAPSPLHLGGARFKMYFGTPSDRTGANTSSKLPFPGPKRVVYANGARTGATDTVDYADWDARTSARDVTFVWPSGTALTTTEEGYLDDFVHLTPTFDKSLQVAYLAMTDGTMSPFSVVAILANP
jgi:hypothetical protein